MNPEALAAVVKELKRETEALKVGNISDFSINFLLTLHLHVSNLGCNREPLNEAYLSEFKLNSMCTDFIKETI